MGSTANRARSPTPENVIGKASLTEHGCGNGQQKSADDEGRPGRDHRVEPRHGPGADQRHHREAGTGDHGRCGAGDRGERVGSGGGQPDQQAEPEQRQDDDR